MAMTGLTSGTTGAAQGSAPLLLRHLAESLAMVGAATLLGLVIAPTWGAAALDLIYLLPVLASASFYGLRPALFAGLSSALAYNFFFTEPVHTFRIDDPADVVTVAILLVVAVVTSQLAARMREQAQIAAANAARNATIAGFAGRLLSCSTVTEIGQITCRQLATLLECNAVLVAGGAGQAELVTSEPPDVALTPADLAAAALAVDQGETAGRGSPRLNPAEWLFQPLKSSSTVLAAVGLARDDGARPVADEQLPLLDSLLDQAALALERARLEQEMRDVAQVRERDRLRRVLLSSVGHDLRTPLTAIVAAAEALRRRPNDLPELGAMIETEARRLERYVANLLDMARIESGAIRLKIEPVDLVDAVAAAAHDFRHSQADRELVVDVPADLPLVRADPQLLHHCLINLLDNAGRYSPPHSTLLVRGRQCGAGVVVEVVDEGPGVPAEGGAEVFERFTRIEGSDRKGGTGLGLAIVSGLAEAMSLRVSAANRADRKGAIFGLHFPAELAVDQRPEEASD
ncbi:MAG: sensor histidine kinase [Allosphingosinicella sp.]